MKAKKILAFLTSAVIMLGMFTCVPSSAVEKLLSSSLLSSILGDDIEVTQFEAQAAGTLRRPVSNEQPMWIVHIDSWNYADPAKIIDLIPKDVLPYCVFNISLSINWDSKNHKWLMIQDGYNCAKSWLRTCADKGVWAMIQPASGGQCHFPDYSADYDLDKTIFGEFFRDYPNFIGYNYCEQFWGFSQADFPITYQDRYRHFSALLKLCNKYGGYLDISICENMWGTALNPIGLLKQVPEWEKACRLYSENYILEEKYTQTSYIADIESEVYGAYVAGYCGNFGVRWDDTGWSDSTWSGTGEITKNQYRVSCGLPIFLERMVQNGMTVIDGPELVWADDFKELWPSADSEGYTTRKWAMYDQYQNDIIDLFRKVQDKTIRIPDRQEVIDRTKVVVIQDITTGNDESKYSTYSTLFEGLYRMPNDGNLRDNRDPYKSTGRYQTIPTITGFADDLAKSIPVQIKQSQIASRWSSIKAKQEEFNKLYASDYWGNCYAGRNENTWVAYNPNKTGTAAGGVLSLKYNTCKNVDIAFSAYGSAVMNEYSDHIDFYLNNFDEEAATTLRATTIKIAGCKSEPQITLQKDRGVNQAKTSVSTSYSDGTYTITVNHNGPVDLSVKCSGSETGRQTSYKTAKIVEPEFPAFYEGIRQYEGEFFDYKNVEGNVTNGCNSGITGYWGQGFMKFGTKSGAAVKDTVSTTKAGTFDMTLRYAVTSDVNNVDLYVNGGKVKTLSLAKGSSLSDWKTVKQSITLKEGDNKIELKSTSALASTLYLDCFTVSGDFGDAQTTVEPDKNGYYFHDEFEDINIDWKSRGANKLGLSGRTPYKGGNALLVSERTGAWNGAQKELTPAMGFKPGESYSFSVCVKYVDGLCTERFAFTLQYTDANGKTQYKNIDNKVAVRGEYVQLANTSYTIPADASNVNLVVETASQTMNFYMDEVIGAVKGTKIEGPAEVSFVLGDVNYDGIINVFDLCLGKKGILKGFADNLTSVAADVDQNGVVDGSDVKLMQQFLTGEITEFPIGKKAVTPAEYMNSVSANIVEKEPSTALEEKAGVTYGTIEKKTFYSDICKRNKNMNILLPANYSKDKKYPVLYALHGYFGNEDALLDAGDASLKLRQIIGNAIAEGEAEEMIVVFPDIFASSTHDACPGFSDESNAAYDNFINVLVKEIMPYMEKNYSIKTGRENTAITGFSMGGRESLYIGFSRPDLFGYIGATCPAPGLTTDLFNESELKFTSNEPYLLLLSAGSTDDIVTSVPEGYHNAMTANGTTHLWHYVIGGYHGGNTIRPHIYNFVRALFKA